MKSVDLIFFMTQTIKEYHLAGQPSAARVCRATLKQIIAFNGRNTMSFNSLTPGWLQFFEAHLKEHFTDNTTSTYLRMLQSVYNKAVYQQAALFIPLLFKKVYKGRAASRSRALTQKELQTVAYANEESIPHLVRTRDLFLLLFLLRGLPFVDLVYLRRCNLQGNRLSYCRHKTGKQMTVQLTPEAMKIIKRYANPDAHSPYLFPFLAQADKDKHKLYEHALKQFNTQLKQLGVLLGLSIPLTSYCARHSWATFANGCHFDKKLISEGMGHSSVQVTEIYFQKQNEDEIGKMNLGIIAYALSERGQQKRNKRSKRLIISN